MNWGLEADALNPLLYTIDTTHHNLTWISPKVYFADRFHAGVELIHDMTEPSSVGTVSSDFRAPTTYRGLSVGFYPSGYLNNSFKLAVGGGGAKRDFREESVGTLTSFASWYMVEAGFQMTGSPGLLSLSVAYIGSSVKENQEMSPGFTLRRSNPNIVGKLMLGFIY